MILRALLAAFSVAAIASPATAQQLRVPKDVDYGASGLVQFVYECPGADCEVRCFIHGANALTVKPARSATFTSYRSHGRQNAPEKIVAITAANDAADQHHLNFAGDGGCLFERMRQSASTGFVSRITREIEPVAVPGRGR